MQSAAPAEAGTADRRIIQRQDYRPPAFTTESVELDMRLAAETSLVTAVQRLRRNPAGTGDALVLQGDEIELVELAVDGRPRDLASLEIEGESLTLRDLPDAFTLTVTTRLHPAANSKLMGLYASGGMLVTQCEPEGFRRISWFQDRPDVMARYRVRLEAEKRTFPVLLANGNLVEAHDLPDGRHVAVWDDPFPKPSYLFAVVAGDLALLEDSFTTMSGRVVALRIWASEAAIGQCGHAMDSLKRSMRWDEERYGLEYDLDIFQIVAVDDFNFGAMENKSLNIFNTAAILAHRDTATDADFNMVERIIAHEYFHNWTGDRVTCRDWFQLTLKEGLTVFRDQQFAADMHSPPVKRIGDVIGLREGQFAEDAGPLAHPIRPDSYVEINNFYTRTVYDKGAEIIRMLHTMLGEDDYRRGIDLYFQRHDGQAVTCDDFVAAMADASGRDLDAFKLWYEQAGTPKLTVRRSYDAERGALHLDIAQETPPTPGQADKRPLTIPIRLGLVGRDGAALPLRLEGENAPHGTDRVVELTEASGRFTFVDLDQEPVPSLLRDFSAPVRLDAGYSKDELALLMGADENAFARWEAGQALALQLILEQVARASGGHPIVIDDALVEAFRRVLGGDLADGAFVSRALLLPGRGYVAQQLPTILVGPLFEVMETFRAELGRRLGPTWAQIYAERHDRSGGLDTAAMGHRALKNTALGYLAAGGVAGWVELAEAQYAEATTMTDRLAAMRLLVDHAPGRRDGVLEDFHHNWKHEPLVLNKWFGLQAAIEDADAPERVDGLTRHPDFSWSNPNRLRSVLGPFAASNLPGFHRQDGAGYRLIADAVLKLDPRNPQVAARLLTVFGRWRRYDEGRQALMRGELERILAQDGLSGDSYEIAKRSLA